MTHDNGKIAMEHTLLPVRLVHFTAAIREHYMTKTYKYNCWHCYILECLGQTHDLIPISSRVVSCQADTHKGERWPSELGRRPATGRSMVRVPLR